MRRLLTWAMIAAAIMLALPVAAADKKAAGTIKGYECGDNCYLTIKTNGGKVITALCAAKACDPWNEQAAIPEKLIGRSVKVTIGTGQQYDGSGNAMGEFPAFTKVAVGKK
jgi:hypothetical protein